MPLVDVSELQIGFSLGDGLLVTSVLLESGVIIVGTDSGCVMVFAPSPDGGDGRCVFARSLHNGAVHCLCLSSAELFASAGHDASPLVQPFASLCVPDAAPAWRLFGHTLPITAATFFANGVWLATVGLGGRLLVFDAAARAVLCDVSVGFSARCVALAPDETVCYLAGDGVARVDLYEKDRPAAARAPLSAESALARGEWSEDGDVFCAQCAPRRFVAALRVSARDGALTAHYAHIRPTGAAEWTAATWTPKTTGFWRARDYRPAPPPAPAQSGRPPRFTRVWVRTGEDAPSVGCAADGWDTWRSARVCVETPPSCVAPKEDAMAREERRGKALQAECDELVRRIRTLMQSRRRKRAAPA